MFFLIQSFMVKNLMFICHFLAKVFFSGAIWHKKAKKEKPWFTHILLKLKTHAKQRFGIVATSSKIHQIRNYNVYWKDQVVCFKV